MSSNTISNNTCANCGKEGSDVTNTCNKCKEVMYCNAACKKKHRHKHKKECERKVAELHEERLFKQPPTLDDCPICFLRMPSLTQVQTYMTCCGKTLCRGCVHAFRSRAYEAGRVEEDDICPFCRTPPPTTNEELIQRYKKRMELNDAKAIYGLGIFHFRGRYGLPQNMAKALELWHRAGELGSFSAYNNIGSAYHNGVVRDKKKAQHYFELAAMKGNVLARHNLGVVEMRAGNFDRALKHYMIAVEDGYKDSLEGIKALYMEGHATKDDYTTALERFQEYVDEVKSGQRDEAAVYNAKWKYY